MKNKSPDGTEMIRYVRASKLDVLAIGRTALAAMEAEVIKLIDDALAYIDGGDVAAAAGILADAKRRMMVRAK